MNFSRIKISAYITTPDALRLNELYPERESEEDDFHIKNVYIIPCNINFYYEDHFLNKPCLILVTNAGEVVSNMTLKQFENILTNQYGISKN